MSWKAIRDFYGYSVSDSGQIRNDRFDRIMALQRNQHGVVHVGLFRGGKQFKRSVALLVADAFLPAPEPPTFDTPIHLDGDQCNNHVDNLMWRPRWFAILYHKQFNQSRRGFGVPIQDVKSGEIFPDSFAAAVRFGLLDHDIFLATLNRTYVWPTYQRFVTLD